MTTLTTLQAPRALRQGGCWWPAVRWAGLASMVGPFSLLGCSLLEGSVQPLPAGEQNPSFYNTPAGALELRNMAIVQIQSELPSYLINTGLLTDELQTAATGQSSEGPSTGLDARVVPTGFSTGADGDYSGLQAVRGSTNQAIGTLATYDSAAPPALRGELYALQGYAEILLADFFCSGVPLSTLDYQKIYTYHASSTTAQVYQDALAQETTALALTSDSARLQNLARVLQGRALLALDSVAAAAQAVAAVPDGFQYQLAIDFRYVNGQIDANGSYNLGLIQADNATMSDREGENGLAYISSQDPRTSNFQSYTSSGTTIIQLDISNKYGIGGFTPFTVADWIEARLIQAEAALRANPNDPTWLTLLNRLRETATVPGQTTTPMTDLTDPGNSPGDTARIALLFRERAYWLYLTGHRQGDLRRLIRQYGPLRQDQVYPTGPTYGTDVDAPIPQAELDNPLFHGCLDRNA
jgi:hypothetical protein